MTLDERKMRRFRTFGLLGIAVEIAGLLPNEKIAVPSAVRRASRRGYFFGSAGMISSGARPIKYATS